MFVAIRRLVGAVVTLLLLLGVLGMAAGALLWLDGPPHLPDLPPLAELPTILQIEGLPAPAVRYLLATLGWLGIGWAIIVIVHTAIASVVEALRAGVAGLAAVGARGGRLGDVLLRGPVRNLVMAAWMLVVLLRSGAPTATVVEARAGIAAVQEADPRRDDGLPVLVLDGAAPAATVAAQPAPCAVTSTYTVVPGDTLTRIAARVWGDPSLAAAEAIFQANEDQVVQPGRRLTDIHLIVPGDVLRIPARAEIQPCDLVEYEVKPGDTLSQIAGRFRGNPADYMVIFQLNYDRVGPHGFRLRDKNLIVPGLQLTIPVPRSAPVVEPAVAAPPAPTPAPTEEARPIASGPAEVAAGLDEAEPVRQRPPRPARAVAVATPPALPAVAAIPEPAAAPDALAPPIIAPAAPTVAAGPDACAGAAVVGAADGQRTQPLLAGLLAGAGATGVVIGGGFALARRRRARLQVTPDREVPLIMATPAVEHPATGAATRALAPQLEQRRAGLETDNRVVATARCLAALRDDLGLPYVTVLSLVDRAQWLQFRLMLGAGQPIDLAAVEEQLQTSLCSPVEVTLVRQEMTEAAGVLCQVLVTCGEVASDRRWAAGLTPPTPLVEVGATTAGRVSVGLLGLASGLLFAGEQAAVALESAIFSLAALYRPGERGLGLVLLTEPGLAEAFLAPAPLPHLVRPPVASTSHEAGDTLAALHDELRRRESGTSTDRRHYVLVIDRPEAVDGPMLRAVLRDGPEHGIYGLVALTGAWPPEPALLAVCQGRVVTALADEAVRDRLLGGRRAGGGDQAWLVLEDAEPVPLQLLRMTPDDRRQLLTLLASAPRPVDGATDDGATMATDQASAGPPPSLESAIEDGVAGDDDLAPIIAAAAPAAEPLNQAIPEAAVAATFPDGVPTEPRLAVPEIGDRPAVVTRPLDADGTEWPSPPPGWLGVRVCGMPSLTYGDRPVPLADKPLELVLYLAAHRGQAVGIDAIVTDLWPDQGTARELRGALQATVSRAREQLRTRLAALAGAADPRQMPELILTESGAYRLNPDAVWIDAAAIRARLARQQQLSDDDTALPLLEEVLRLYRGEFCAEKPYAWCDEQRRIYEAMAERCGRAVAAGFARQHRYREAIQLYEDLRRANPLDEELARFEMICQALVNNRPAVRRVFEEVHRAVTAAFDGAESVTEETVELYQGLVGGTTRPCVEVILAGSPRPAYA